MSSTDLPKVSEDIFRLVIKLNETIFKQDEFLKSMPFPPSHVKVIFYLVHKSPTTMSEMAHKLCISKSNMTPIIDKLIEEGLAERAENPKDRRTILITTTDKALELFESHKKLIKARLASRIECLCTEDLETLHQSILMALPLLDKINHS